MKEPVEVRAGAIIEIREAAETIKKKMLQHRDDTHLIREILVDLSEVIGEWTVGGVPPPSPKPPAEAPRKRSDGYAYPTKACCGSKGRRHKNGCTETGRQAPIKRDGPREVTCTGCEKQSLLDPELDIMETRCQGCGGRLVER